MSPDELLMLMENDEFDLLKVNPKCSKTTSEDEHLLSSFQEINKFVHQHGYEPRLNTEDTKEYSLNKRLDGIRKNVDKIQKLQGGDLFGLLKSNQSINTIEEIFKNDDLGLLSDGMDSIFNLRHVPRETLMPDRIAQRTPCLDFDNFQLLFLQCHADLSSGKRQLLPFAVEQQISKGDFYILRGILTYVSHVGEKENVNGKTNARLRCIFENGTESDLLLRSLARALYKDGRRVTENIERIVENWANVESGEAKDSGYIYVLRSLSERYDIKVLNNLYKIGFSRRPVEERIKNAEKEPTYLMARVSVVAIYQCFNLDLQKFELFLHTFFAKSCLNIEVSGKDGKLYRPREWFIAPIKIINEAIELLRSRDIVNYRYDEIRQEIVEK